MGSVICWWTGPAGSSLSKNELKEAEEAKQRVLDILHDALKKKDRLLVKNPKDFGYHLCCGLVPLISPRLVQDLITELQKVTFARGSDKKKDTCIAYVYPHSDERVIYLCPPFWEESELLGANSRPITIIHEVAHFLGYGHTVLKTMVNSGKKPFDQWKLLPLTTYSMESAFARFMNHDGIYMDGFYGCCGERARDSVCVKSEMGFQLRIQKVFSMSLMDRRDHIVRSLLNDWEMMVKPQGRCRVLQINFPESSTNHKAKQIKRGTSISDG